jgi:hypothetical protein
MHTQTAHHGITVITIIMITIIHRWSLLPLVHWLLKCDVSADGKYLSMPQPRKIGFATRSISISGLLNPSHTSQKNMWRWQVCLPVINYCCSDALLATDTLDVLCFQRNQVHCLSLPLRRAVFQARHLAPKKNSPSGTEPHQHHHHYDCKL